MNPWTLLVGLIERGIGGTAEVLGGRVGLGVFALVLGVRLALIPLLLPLARRTRSWRAVHRTIRPQIRVLQKTHRDDPTRLQHELKMLYEGHGIRLLDTAGLLMALIQVPVLIAFFQAVLHVSAGTALASGGLVYGVVAGVVSYGGTVVGDATTPKALLWLSGLLPVLIAWWLGSGVGVYLVAFYLGTLVQSVLSRRAAVVPAGSA